MEPESSLTYSQAPAYYIILCYGMLRYIILYSQEHVVTGDNTIICWYLK